MRLRIIENWLLKKGFALYDALTRKAIITKPIAAGGSRHSLLLRSRNTQRQKLYI
jgi:hypothetical protein